MERKLFQQLLDLKQMQIRIGRANEQVLAKRLIDGLRKDAITVDLRPYDGSYSFHQLEVYLYSWVKSIFVKKYKIFKKEYLQWLGNADQLRLVQDGRILPLVDSNQDDESIIGLFGEETESTAIMPASQCTRSTQRCPHAMYAYTALPPACYTGAPFAALSK